MPNGIFLMGFPRDSFLGSVYGGNAPINEIHGYRNFRLMSRGLT